MSLAPRTLTQLQKLLEERRKFHMARLMDAEAASIVGTFEAGRELGHAAGCIEGLGTAEDEIRLLVDRLAEDNR